MAHNSLNFKRTKLLEWNANMLQVDDGTMFYSTNSPPSVYVIWKGQQVYLNVDFLRPGPCVLDLKLRASYGNVVYFTNWQHLYTATFSPSTAAISVSFVRELREDEMMHRHEVCSRMRGELKLVYRLCDIPDKGDMFVDDKVDGIPFIHRKIAFLLKQNLDLVEPTVRKLHGNTFLIEMPFNFVKPHARDSSRLVYFIVDYAEPNSSKSHQASQKIGFFDTTKDPVDDLSCHKKLCTLDTESMEFLPTLKLGDGFQMVTDFAIHNEKITIVGNEKYQHYSRNEQHLFHNDFKIRQKTVYYLHGVPFCGPVSAAAPYEYGLHVADLPKGYFEKAVTVDELSAAMSQLGDSREVAKEEIVSRRID